MFKKMSVSKKVILVIILCALTVFLTTFVYAAIVNKPNLSHNAVNEWSLYEPYGVTYDTTNKTCNYNGQRVKLFIDQNNNGTSNSTYSMCFIDEQGTLNIKAIRDVNQKITGIEIASDEFANGVIAGYRINPMNGNNDLYNKPQSINLNNSQLSSFKSVDITVNYANVEFINSDKYGIEIYYYDDNYIPTYEVKNEILKVSDTINPKYRNKNNGGYYNNQGNWNFNNNYINEVSYVKIYLPKDANYENILVNSNDGDILVGNINCNDVDIKSSYGNVTTNDINTNNLVISINDGTAIIKDVTTNTFKYTNSYGDSIFENMYGLNNNPIENIDMKVNDGNVDILNLKSKIISYQNQYGDTKLNNIDTSSIKMDVNNGEIDISSSKLGNLEITNQYGETKLKDCNTISLDIDSNDGNIDLMGEILGNNNIVSSYGNIKINTTLKEAEYNYKVEFRFGSANINSKKYSEEDNKLNIDNKAKNNFDLKCSDGSINIITK